MTKYPFFNQTGNFDCGIACIRMIAQYYEIAFEKYRLESSLLDKYTSMRMLCDLLLSIEIRSKAFEVSIKQLENKCKTNPAILHWNKNHFIVIYYSYKKNGDPYYIIADPKLEGLVVYNKRQLSRGWNINNNSDKISGYAILTIK